MKYLMHAFLMSLLKDEGKNDGAGGAGESKSTVTYSIVLNRLLLEIVSNNYVKNSARRSDSSASDDVTLPFMLDPLLRQLGMLDPDLFHKTVKTALDKYLLVQKNTLNPLEHSENIPRNSQEDVDSNGGSDGDVAQNTHVMNVLLDMLDHGSMLINFKNGGGTN